MSFALVSSTSSDVQLPNSTRMEEKSVESVPSQTEGEGPVSRPDRATTKRDGGNNEAGVHTDEKLYSAVARRSDDRTDSSIEYAEVVGIENTAESFVFSVQFADGTIESIKRDRPQDARIDGDLRLLYYYFLIDSNGPEQIHGEIVPVRRTASGVTLELGVEPPPSNRINSGEPSSDLSGFMGSLQPYTDQMQFSQLLIALVAILFTMIPLLVVAALSAISVGTPLLPVLLVQLFVAVVLFVRSYL